VAGDETEETNMQIIMVPAFTKAGRRSRVWFALVRVMESGDAAHYAPGYGGHALIHRAGFGRSAVDAAAADAPRVYREAKARRLCEKANSANLNVYR
jgi:hypothetical protein